MKVLIQGSNDFTNEAVFLRAMGVALSDFSMRDGTVIEFHHIGPRKVSNLVVGFCNMTEDRIRGVARSIRAYPIAYPVASKLISTFDYFIYLDGGGQKMSPLVALAESVGVEVGVFRYT